MPGTSGTRPVALETAAISTIVLVPSLKALSILGFMPLVAASATQASGVAARSMMLFLPLPRATTSKPMSSACSQSILSTPGSSPEATV